MMILISGGQTLESWPLESSNPLLQLKLFVNSIAGLISIFGVFFMQ
jgi:hypothetical protein